MQEDIVCLMCTSGDSTKRGFLAAEGFGSLMCHLEPEPHQVATSCFAILLSCKIPLIIVMSLSYIKTVLDHVQMDNVAVARYFCVYLVAKQCWKVNDMGSVQWWQWVPVCANSGVLTLHSCSAPISVLMLGVMLTAGKQFNCKSYYRDWVIMNCMIQFGY